MIGKGNITVAFERAMKGLILEGDASTYLSLAQSTNIEDKDELFNTINNDLFGGKAPFGDRLEMKSFSKSSMSKVAKTLSKDKNSAEILFNTKVDGIGRGEIMLAYIVKNLCIGGGSASIDLTIFNKRGGTIDQAELKEVKIDGSGWMHNWRTGANHRQYINQAIEDLRNLYNGLQGHMIELDPSTPAGKEIKRKVGSGEMTGFLSIIRDIDPAEIIAPLSFDIQISPTEDLTIATNGKLIGDLSKKETLDKIRAMLSAQNIIVLKSFNTIETELAAGFGSVKEKFVFIEGIGKGQKSMGRIIYMDNLPGTTDELIIGEVTQGIIKVKVKI